MGRLFKISGNYEKDGEWKKPDPFYTGKIVVENEKDGQFYGFVEELCPKDSGKLKDRRYIVGRFENGTNGYKSIQFYAISNNRRKEPRKVLIPDLAAGSHGVWFVKPNSLSNFKPKGKASFTCEELEYMRSKATQVKKKYLEIDLKIIEELTAFMIGGLLADVGLKGLPESEKPGL